MNQLIDYIEQARKKGLDDDAIKNNMIVAGWDTKIVEAGLKAKLDDLPVPPPPIANAVQQGRSNEPVSVVQNLSTRGFEYVIMFLAMGISAVALGFLLHDTLDSSMGNTHYSYLDGYVAYSTAALVVALPVFMGLFLRLKKAELADKTLRNDPSRRRAIQLTLIITFLVGVFNLIGYIYSLMNAGTGTRNYSTYGSTAGTVASDATLNLLHMLITLVIAGGIFAYYWIDSHKKEK